MTRTIDRLVLTYDATRAGKPTRGHQFLDEAGLTPRRGSGIAMTATEWRVAVGDATTSAVYEPATSGRWLARSFVCAHGAGGNMSDRATLAAANALRAADSAWCGSTSCTRKGSGRPGSDAEADGRRSRQSSITSRRAGAAAAAHDRRPSMGGRAASMLAADGFAADGLLLLAYPLHPPGKPEKLRDAHLPRITMPVLCFNGTRDALCTPALMERVLEDRDGAMGDALARRRRPQFSRAQVQRSERMRRARRRSVTRRPPGCRVCQRGDAPSHFRRQRGSSHG